MPVSTCSPSHKKVHPFWVQGSSQSRACRGQDTPERGSLVFAARCRHSCPWKKAGWAITLLLSWLVPGAGSQPTRHGKKMWCELTFPDLIPSRINALLEAPTQAHSRQRLLETLLPSFLLFSTGPASCTDGDVHVDQDTDRPELG